MKNSIIISKSIILVIVGILCCQSLLSQIPDISQKIMGEWKYQLFIYRGVGRYGQKEVDAIKSSVLCFKKDRIYFTDVTFIDTCFYSEFHPKVFFDREDKHSHYLLDGPLAIKYSEEQLSKFIRIDLNCRSNGFGTFYLNGDTLILNSTGGATFFFTKK